MICLDKMESSSAHMWNDPFEGEAVRSSHWLVWSLGKTGELGWKIRDFRWAAFSCTAPPLPFLILPSIAGQNVANSIETERIIVSNILSNQHVSPLLVTNLYIVQWTKYVGSSWQPCFLLASICTIFPAPHNQPPPLKPQEGSYWSDGLGRQQVDINIDWRPGSVSGFLLAAVDMILVIVSLV